MKVPPSAFVLGWSETKAKKAERKGVRYGSLKERVEPVGKDKISKLALLGEKKKGEVIKETTRKIPLLYALMAVVLVACITGAVVLVLSYKPVTNPNPVREGDIVQIAYVGMLENGSVFDSGNYTFRTGSGEVIEGVDKAVIGMKIGEKKTVTLSPEEAYGYYDPNNVIVIPLVQELNQTVNTTRELFKLTFEEDPEPGKLYELRGMEWPVRVLSVQNETVTVRHEPEDGMIFDMKDNVGEVYGTSSVTLREGKIILTSHPIEGKTVTTVMGEGRITEVNETHMKMDFNHKLAGKTLVFEITLLNFIPR